MQEVTEFLQGSLKGSINFKEDVSNRKIKEFIKNVENSKTNCELY